MEIVILILSLVYIFAFVYTKLDDLVDDIIDRIKNYFQYTRKGIKRPQFVEFDPDKLFEKKPIRDLYLDFIYRPLYRIRDFPNTAKFYIKRSYQRSVRGWADSDTWCFSGFLSPTISEMTKYLKKNKMGIPCQVLDEADEIWNKILDNIIYTFEMAEKIKDMDVTYLPSDEWTRKEFNKINKNYKESKYLEGRCLTLAECKKYEEGWRLFQKYYFNLWD